MISPTSSTAKSNTASKKREVDQNKVDVIDLRSGVDAAGVQGCSAHKPKSDNSNRSAAAVPELRSPPNTGTGLSMLERLGANSSHGSAEKKSRTEIKGGASAYFTISNSNSNSNIKSDSKDLSTSNSFSSPANVQEYKTQSPSSSSSSSSSSAPAPAVSTERKEEPPAKQQKHNHQYTTNSSAASAAQGSAVRQAMTAAPTVGSTGLGTRLCFSDLKFVVTGVFDSMSRIEMEVRKETSAILIYFIHVLVL